MVNHETSENLLDKLILQIFEDQEDAFSFPLTTMKQTRDFVRLVNRQGFTYEMICAEIDEKFEAFRSWRLGGGPDAIGRRMMMRINKPLQEAMLSDGEDEDEETMRNGTTEGKAAGGARRKKSMDGGGTRRGSRADKVDGGKKGKVKEAKDVSVEGSANKVDGEKKGEVKGQHSTVQGVESDKTDIRDGKNALDKQSKSSSPNNDVQLPDSTKSENATAAERRDETGKDNTTTAVATAKDATPNKSVRTNKDDTSKARYETVKHDATQLDINAHIAKKDVSKGQEKSTDAKKEQDAEAGKKELETSTEAETKAMTNRKSLEADIEAKLKSRAESETKSPGVDASKLNTDEKQEPSKKANVVTKKDQRTSAANRKEDDERVEKATAVSSKTPSINQTFTKPSDTNLEKSPAGEKPGSPHQATTISPTQSSMQCPISPTLPPFKPGPPATESRQIPELQTPSEKEKKGTDNVPKTKIDADTPSKSLEHVSLPTKQPSNNAGISFTEQKSNPDQYKDNTSAENNLKTDNGLATKILPGESKTSSTGQDDKAVAKAPQKQTSSSTLTAENQFMAKPANVIRSKSETVEPKIAETPTAPHLTRTSSDSAEPFRPSATPLKPDLILPTTKIPPSDANQPAVDENYDSDLDPETSDRSAEDRILFERLCSLKRNETIDGPGHLFVFSDTPAATGTGKHRVRIGISRFPEKRLQQAQLFNPDLRMVTSVAVATRKDALCRTQEELKSMSLRGKRGWYWGSLDVILEVVTNLSVIAETTE